MWNKDGELLLAIETRYDFKQFIGGKDPHVNLYFTSFMPRWIAILISCVMSAFISFIWLFKVKNNLRSLS